MQYVIIAGGRDFNDTDKMCESINVLMDEGFLDESFVLVSGMAKGADLTAYNLLKSNGFTCEEYHADWKDIDVAGAVVKHNQYGAYNAVAGHMRNAEMAIAADTLVAFWDGNSRGTKDMIDRMNKLNKKVRVINY